MSDVLKRMREKNEYPIVFIGSGMSRRYLLGFPSWTDLLKEFWDKLNTGKNFYGFLNALKRGLQDQGVTEDNLDYEVNITAGSEIEKLYNEKFNDGEIIIDGFTPEDAFKTNISPLKKAIANRFSSYEIKTELSGEFEGYKAFLNKTQIVITTNYDPHVEESVSNEQGSRLKRYVGQKGFFEETLGWAELYKIHGCVSEPASIVISRSDYETFSKNSILISAKIISMLIHSPIIFLGYSLTDGNVRKIIRDFSSSLSSKEAKIMASKIIIVDWQEGENGIIEQSVTDKDLGCEYTVLRTDNFENLFSILSGIDQGIHPSEVRKYQHVIKQLIVSRGKEGSLNALLLTPDELDDIEKRIGDGKLVVALGDATYVFQIPDLMSYLYDYFSIDPTQPIHMDIALRYIASQTGRLPFLKHFKNVNLDKTNLHPIEVEKLKQRIKNSSDINALIKTIPGTYKVKYESLEQILDCNNKLDREYEIIAFNSPHLELDEICCYLMKKITMYKSEGVRSLMTSFRRLLLAYDILKNK
jgi:hypothetical protein